MIMGTKGGSTHPDDAPLTLPAAVMHTFLLLTDTPARGTQLARGLDDLGSSLVIDVLDPEQADLAPAPGSILAVISDVSFTGSQPLIGIKRHLDRLGPGRPPYFCLLREDTPGARAKAQALGATRTLRADEAARLMRDAITPLIATKSDHHPSVAEDVTQADAVLTRIFRLGLNGGAVTPAVITAGADLIEGALRKSDVKAWLDVVWRFDDATHQHCLLVAGLAAGFGMHLGLRPADCRQLTEAALLHDIGKSRIPLAILNKPGRLDADETVVMREHPILGDEMLRDQGFPALMLTVVRSHHELLDGSGYPDGLRGDAIPDLVRLITICDIFGALIERRPYKIPMGGDEAYEILQGMGDKLDADLVRAFRPIANHVGIGAMTRLH